MTQSYSVPATPTFVIEGKYIVLPSMTANPDKSVSYGRFVGVVDKLIAQARKARGLKSPVSSTTLTPAKNRPLKPCK
jgi:hypothetical protein